MYVKFKTILRANLVNYNTGSSQTEYAGNVADTCSSWTKSRQLLEFLIYDNGSLQTNYAWQIIVQAGQNLVSHWNFCIFLPHFDEVYLFRNFLLFII
jgi:hypothetical protein